MNDIWRRIEDRALLARADLRESLAQMARGEGTLVRPDPAEGEHDTCPRCGDQIEDHNRSDAIVGDDLCRDCRYEEDNP